MRINNNIMAMNTHRQYGVNNNNVSKSVEKLSSGYRVNRAGDDAAGLAISEKMRAQIRGLNMASKNSQDAVSLVQTAEGALQSTHDILQRMRELATQSSSDTNETTIDRDALNKEFQALIAEIDDTAAKTKFNDMGIIDGTFAGAGKTTTVTGGATTATAGASVASSVAAGTYTVAYTYTAAVANDTAATGAASGTGSTLVTAGTKTAAQGEAGNVAYSIGVGTYSAGSGIDLTITGDDGSTKTVKITEAQLTAAVTAGAAGTDIDVDLGTDIGSIKFTYDTSAGTGTHETNAKIAAAIIADLGTDTKITFTGGETKGDAKAEMIVTDPNSVVSKVELKAGDTSATAGGVTVTFANALSAFTNQGELTTAVGTAPTSVAVTASTKTIAGKDFVVQTGANTGDELSINIAAMDAGTLGVKGVDIKSRAAASAAITTVNTAINNVSSQRADLGALQNRLEFKISNLDTSAENLQSAESRIRDLDMAQEMTKFTKNNILSQAATAMLAQANSLPQGVLQLLR